VIISLTHADAVADDGHEPVLVTLGPEELGRLVRTLVAQRRRQPGGGGWISSWPQVKRCSGELLPSRSLPARRGG
jgi:hypothetical protein